MKTISISELHDASKSLQSTDLILDVRTPLEFAQGHIPQSKNIPVDQVAHHADELKKHSAVYIYCKVGGRASVGYEILSSLGVKNIICVDDGGFPDWASSGYPVEK